MKNFLIWTSVTLTALFTSFFPPASAQTLSLNDAAITQSKTQRIGINIGAIDYYDNGQILKNLVGTLNPGFEPLTSKQIWALTSAGTSTSFSNNDMYDSVQENYWAGATFTVVASQTNNGQQGCTGTITGNTGQIAIKSIVRSGGVVTLTTVSPSGYRVGNQIVVSNVTDSSFNAYPSGTIASVSGNTIVYSQAGANSTSTGGFVDQLANVTYTTTACGGPFSVGDIVLITTTILPTPEASWENSSGGFWAYYSGGGKLTADTTDLCATCGSQAITFDATASGSVAGANWYYDGDFNGSPNIDVLMNGVYEISFWAKTASGSPKLTVNAVRTGTGGFSCGNFTQAPAATWTQYTFSCTASETQSGTAVAPAHLAITAQGGAVYLDNVSFEKTGSNQSSVFRDEVISTLEKFQPGTFRYWVNQNGESLDNWTRPSYQRGPSSAGATYGAGPVGGGGLQLSLEDYLVATQTIGSQPYLVVPVTFTVQDAANLIEFLAGSSSTTYGARRAALGQEQPWTSVFTKIHLSFGNESWNYLSFPGQNLSYRSNAPNDPNCGWGCPNEYYDYSVRAKAIFAAMRSAADYSQTAFDLVMNIQTSGTFLADDDVKVAQPDSVEIEDYTYLVVNDTSSDKNLWQPAFVEPYDKVSDPNDSSNFYTSLHDYPNLKACGASGTAACNVNIYEWANATGGGSIDQTHLDYINAGAGQGVVAALEPLLNLQYYGIQNQNYFALTEFYNSGPRGEQAKLWGSTVDMGGATNNVRPQFLAMSLVNQSIIGPMYACPISSNATFNFAGNTSNGTNTPPGIPALNNVPYLYSFCFENGASRSIVLVNTDISNSHTISFAGTNTPQGTVKVRQYAPGALDDMNEAPTGAASNHSEATVSIATNSLSSPGSITLPPYSVTALDFTATGSSTIAAPTFAPAGGIYSTAQTVTISDATAGTTIYYTTDGSTPTTSSTQYTGPITVSASVTVEAIAAATGSSASVQAAAVKSSASSVMSSPASSAAYTIVSTLPAPTFSVAAGSYTTAQSVAISDATTGATIYYTTNGTTPTTSSSKYGGAITVSTTETLKAIAVLTGYSNSSAASAAYTIGGSSLPAPAFSAAAGTYTTAQTVTISDAVSGTTIYYTTNGKSPSTSATKYTGPVTVSVTERLRAMAVKTGYTNSPGAESDYTIAPLLPSPTFSVAAGTYTTARTVALAESVGGGSIYYTTNGTTPTTSSTKYSNPIKVSASETIKAIAVRTGYTNSSPASATYTIASVLPTPALSVASGTYSTVQKVAITDATAGATIYYTTNGSKPATSSTKYSNPITISSTTELKAIAVKTGYTNSSAVTAAYTISLGPVAPSFTPAGGTYTTGQEVTISETAASSTIYYTTNGSTPTAKSTKYTGPITVSKTETLKAIAVKTGYTSSSAAATYTIAPLAATPTFSVAAGTYAKSQKVVIKDSTPGVSIYYTTNGSTPTTSSLRYSDPIKVKETAELKAIAVRTGYTKSLAASATYIIR